MGTGRRVALIRSRAVRATSALTLVLAVSSTGLVAFAAPAVAVPAPLILSEPVSPANDRSPTWTFDSAAGLAWECSVDPATDPVTTWTPCGSGGPTSDYTPADLTTDTSYVLSVRQVVTGDTADIARSTPYALDTVATGTVAPVVTPTNSSQPSWTISLEPGAGSSASCQVDGLGTPEPCSGTWQTPQVLGDGTHTLTVALTDDLLNTGTATATVDVDTTAPVTPVPAGPPALTNDPRLSWTWTASPDTASAACALITDGVVGAASTCAGTQAHAATATGDGVFALQVTLTDTAGNISTPGTSSDTTYDGTAPDAPVLVTGPPSSPATDTLPEWTFTTPGVSTTCVLTSLTSGSQDLGDCQATGPTGTARPTALADDAWTLTVTTVDAAGNTATLVTPQYVVDTTGPAAPAVTRPAIRGNDPAPRFTWTGELPSTALCRQIGTTAAGADATGPWVDCTGRYLDLALTEDGDYAVEAQLTDPLGNVGVLGTSGTYTYDGTAPAPADLTSVPLLGRNPAPTYTFAVETGGSASCLFTAGGVPGPTSDCSGGSYTPSLPGEGAYVVEVVTRDAVGNTASASRDYALDTTLPDPASIVSPPSPSNDTTPAWGITGDGSTLTCRLTGTVPPTPTTSCTSGYLGDLTGQVDGTYSLEVTATDAAGNTSVVTVPYVLDTTAPSAPPVTAPASPGNAFSPSWTFPVETDTSAQCRLVQGLSVGTWSACNGGSFTVADLLDGTYTVEVLVTDLAGNSAPVATSPAYTSDRTAPGAPAVDGPSGVTNNPSPSWSWTGEAGVTASCRLDRAGVIGADIPCSSGTFSPTLTGDTSYVVSVQLFDAAGNASPWTTAPGLTLDTGVPDLLAVAGPAGPGNNRTPVWSFGPEPGTAVECALVRDGVPGPWVGCASGQAWPLPADGSYVLQVRQTDAAGNTSPTGTSAVYLYDGTAPVVPVITTPSSPSSARGTTWPFSSEGGTTARCRVLREGALVRDWVACTDPFAVDLTNLPDAEYLIEVAVTDAAGNVSPTAASLPYVLDTTAPDPAVVTGPSGPSTNINPTFTWTGESGASPRCRFVLDGVLQGTSGVSCTSPYTPTLSADGQWSLRVVLVDAAGNRSVDALGPTYVLDTQPPVAPVVLPPASPGRALSPSWSATVETGATTACRLTSGTRPLLDWSPCTLPLTTDLTTEPDGTYELQVRATDAAGQTGPAGSGTYVLDTTAPAAPVFTTTPVSPGRTFTPTFAFTSEPGTTTTCRLSIGTTVLDTDTVCVSPLPISLTGLRDGAYTLTVRAVDSAGNAGPAQTATYVLDTTEPAAPVLVTGPASPSPDRTPTWAFTAESGATVTCRLTGAVVGAVALVTPCTSPFAPPALAAEDTYTFTARAADAAGNTGPALTDTIVYDASAPVTAEVVGPQSPGRFTTVSWQVSAPSGTVQCRLTKGALLLRDWTTCGPTYTANLAKAGEGQYSLAVRVLDAARRASAEVVSGYLLDTTAPAPATLTAPPSPASDRSPTWSIASRDAAVTAECAVTDPRGVVLVPFADCAVGIAGATYTLDLTGRADGPWTLLVRLTDAAGNVGFEAQSIYVLDTGSPTDVLITAPSTLPSSDETPTWRLVGDSDAVLECRLSGPGITSTVFAPCATVPGVPGAGTFTAELALLDDGTYTLTARSRDSAGNLGPERSSGFELDRTPPPAPSDPIGPASPSKIEVITWTFTVSPDATARCTLSSPTIEVKGDQECASPWTTDLAGLGDGLYTLSVRAVDKAGNTSPTVKGRYELDRTSSLPPSIVASPAARSRDTSPTWRLAVSSVGDVLECQLIGTAQPAWAPCDVVTTFDLAPATSGTYVLRARERDAAQNVSDVAESAPYVLDPGALLTPDVVPPTPQRDNDLMPVFEIQRQAQDVDTASLLCEVRRFDGGPATATPCAFDRSTVDLRAAPALAGDADVVLAVRAVDRAGAVSEPATAVYRFDNVRPDTPTIGALAQTSGFDAAVEWTFATADTTDTYRCQLARRGGPVLAEDDCVFPRTLPATGDWTLSVWAVDTAGNRSAVPGTSTYSYLPPVPAVTALRGPTIGTDDSPTWTFTVPRGYAALCSVADAGKVSVAEEVLCSAGTYTAPLAGRSEGVYTLSVILVDGRGNRSLLSSSALYRYRPLVDSGHLGGLPAGPTTRPRPVTPPAGVGLPPPAPRTGPGAVGVADPQPPRGVTPSASPRPVMPRAVPVVPRPAVREVPAIIGRALGDLGRKPTIPLLLLFVVVGFLLLQNQIDRRDPKLASAPMGAEPELDFGPVLGRRPLGGGAPA